MTANPVLLHDIQNDYFGAPPQNPADNPPGGFDYYQIDPSSILADLKIGRSDVFHSLGKEPDKFKPIYPSGTLAWSQEDYMSIAKAHLLYLTGESFEGSWKVYSSGSFGISQCRDEMRGFDYGRIILYKKNPDGSFPVTSMYIKSLNGWVESAYLVYDRRMFDEGFSEAEAMNGKLTADEALQIAEDKGGKAMRQKLSSVGCDVWVNFYGDKFWHVDYSWNTDNLDFALYFEINADDGSYKVSQRMSRCDRNICP
jgi:hypothetical protein